MQRSMRRTVQFSHLPITPMLALLLKATLAQAAGFQFIGVPSDAEGPVLNGAMWSPCAEASGEVDLGNITLPGVKDCPIAGDNLPLVVISHGRGGSFVGHHDIAEVLADAGFIAAAINHPGDTSSDMSRSDNLSVFIERPTDIKRLIDFMLGASPAASRIDPGRIGFFGFSRGGYTGLVLVGTNPDWALATALCEQSSSRICEQIHRKEFPAHSLTHDSRIKAAVIIDPLALLFSADSLQGIKVPIQLWASERGGDGITPDMVAAVDSGLPIKHEYLWSQIPDILRFSPPVSPHWPRPGQSLARMRRTSTAVLSTNSSMPMCSPFSVLS
jgi:predicted dienelactone hydrolase